MWGFVFIAGTFSWLTILQILKVKTQDYPNVALFEYDDEHNSGTIKTKKENDEIVIVDDEDIEWNCIGNKGRRKWIGELIKDLPRHERRAALKIMRDHLQYTKQLQDKESIFNILQMYLSFPVIYSFDHLPERLRKRLLAPVIWTGSNTFYVSYVEWAERLIEWYKI